MAHKWWVLAAIACGTFMATLDSSIVNIALPTLTKELGAGLPQVKWVVIIYLLSITCALLPFGRLSDLYGRRRIFLTGLVLFLVSSALCGFAPSLGWLVFFRLTQGLGAAMLMSNGPAVIAATFTSGERGQALGLLAMVVSAGLISGPSLGGLLISHFSWRSIFLINIPVGILGLWITYSCFPQDRAPPVNRSFDWVGSLVQMLFLLSFIALMEPPTISIGGSAPYTLSRLAALASAALFAALFLKLQKDSRHPLVDFSLFKIQSFWLANLAAFLSFVAFSSVTVLTPFFLEEAMGVTPDRAGLLMTAIPLTILVIAPLSGKLSDSIGTWSLSFAGAAIGAITLFWMAGVFGTGFTTDGSRMSLVASLSLIGLATGLFQSPNNSAIMNDIPIQKLGIASALLATIRNLGLISGTGIATSIFSWRFEQTGNHSLSTQLSFYVAGLSATAAMAISAARGAGERTRNVRSKK